MAMFTAWPMGVRFRGRRGHELSAGQHDVPRLMALGEVIGNIRVIGPHVADEAAEESLRLQVRSGKFRDKRDGAVQNFRSGRGVGNLLGVLFLECLVFFLEVLGKNGHRPGGNVQGAQGASEGLDRSHKLRILPIASIVEIAECDHLNQVKEGHRFFTAQFAHLAIELASYRHELLGQAFSLVVASRSEIDAAGGAGDAHDPMGSTAERANQSAQRWTRPLSFSLLAVDALAHLLAAPSVGGLGGGGMNP